MSKLKLGAIEDDKPVRLTIELPAALASRSRRLRPRPRARRETLEPAKLIAPMLVRFMATDRAFAKLRRSESAAQRPHPEKSGSEKAT